MASIIRGDAILIPKTINGFETFLSKGRFRQGAAEKIKERPSQVLHG